MILQALALVLTQLAVGTLLLVSVLPTQEIRCSFFRFNALCAAIFAALGLTLNKFAAPEGPHWDYFQWLGLVVIGTTVAYGFFHFDRMQSGRFFMIISGVFGLVVGLLPQLDALIEVRLGTGVVRSWPLELNVLAGTFLLGTTHTGLVLGHWYLLMRRLSFVYLERFAKLLMAAAAFEILVFILTLTVGKGLEPKFAAYLPTLWASGTQLFFFSMRILWGLVLPLGLAFLVFRCVQARSNQAATGLLYIAEFSVFFGALLSAFLLV
jgi:hypothetical protein